MKTGFFIIVVLISGCFAGLIHGGINLVIVEPYLDQAIGIENQTLFATGDKEDTTAFWVEHNSYRVWQKGGQVLAGAILGTSLAALVGIVFLFVRNTLPEGNNVKQTLVLSGFMWVTIFVIPFLKYPAIPPIKQSPAPVGSVTLSRIYAGAQYFFPSPKSSAPSTPFLMITYLGPILCRIPDAFSIFFSLVIHYAS